MLVEVLGIFSPDIIEVLPQELNLPQQTASLAQARASELDAWPQRIHLACAFETQRWSVLIPAPWEG